MSDNPYTRHRAPLADNTHGAAEMDPGSGIEADNAVRRANVTRDAASGVLLVVALILPWSLSFGSGVPGGNGWIYLAVILATLLAGGALTVTHRGAQVLFGDRFTAAQTDRARLILNLPYLLVVTGFVVYAIVQAVRYSGTAEVPPGVGPGAWTGLAGSLLAAQPVLTDARSVPERLGRWVGITRILGLAAITLATLATLFNLYQRIRSVVPHLGDPVTGGQSATVLATTIIYGAVALLPVLIASRWLLDSEHASRLTTVVLGGATVAGGVLVWGAEIGRKIDSFHGIAQTTSTTSVGFEGYVTWVAAAAILAPSALLLHHSVEAAPAAAWRKVARNCLLLIAVWSGGSVALRITDLFVAANLHIRYSMYDTVVLMVIDAICAVAALWLRMNLVNSTLRRSVIVMTSGSVLALTFSRIVLGVVLAPRMDYGPTYRPPYNPVYGNDLAHQITSSFDVLVCVLSFVVLGVVITGARNLGRRLDPALANGDIPAPQHDWQPAPSTGPSPQLVRHAPGVGSHILASAPASASPVAGSHTTARIFRPSDGALASGRPDSPLAHPTPPAPPKIARPAPPATAPSSGTVAAGGGTEDSTTRPTVAQILAESSKRFAAGTTYNGDKRTDPPD
ncbi:hypothetical protein OG976_23430 [Mycobacterium sp. NBC_00419]|uniref:DUF7937 domain-containing protein n=1 Tax=Mycobacterium sp. NBC_00419 TaxID=2975989 RepID=UPI002E1E7F08